MPARKPPVHAVDASAAPSDLAAEDRPAAAPTPPRGGFAPVRVDEPQMLTSGVVFSSPHSGRAYFPDFVEGSRLTAHALRASEDAFVDDLFQQAAAFGAPLISATAPRAYIDVNRSPDDLDPSLIDGVEPRAANARVAAGLGVIPRIVAEGMPIYDRRMSVDEARARVERWHAPYHRALVELLLRARRRFGSALLIDCHSMPSGAMITSRRGGGADIVLGDRFGASAVPTLVDRIEASLMAAGFRVARNTPFAGGYITERYGRPAAGVSALQIEIDRGLYMDQATLERTSGFEALRRMLEPVISDICALCSEPSDADLPVAAE